jgi:hypothetical protein
MREMTYWGSWSSWAQAKVENSSGVWVDGQYLGYLKELKGSKKILLLPGEHEIAVRQAGYKDFGQKVNVKPGEKQDIRVAMEKNARAPFPMARCAAKAIRAALRLSLVVFFLRSRRCSYRRRLLASRKN